MTSQIKKNIRSFGDLNAAAIAYCIIIPPILSIMIYLLSREFAPWILQYTAIYGAITSLVSSVFFLFIINMQCSISYAIKNIDDYHTLVGYIESMQRKMPLTRGLLIDNSDGCLSICGRYGVVSYINIKVKAFARKNNILEI